MSEPQEKSSIDWLTKLLVLQGLDAGVTGSVVADAAGESYWLTIDHSQLTSAQIDSLLGGHGEVLDSIQYLANTVLNLGLDQDQQQAYTVELAGYRAQRLEELKALAHQAATQAQESAQEVEIPQLSSAERRQVHNFLKAYDGLETFSRGREPDRRLVVRLLGEHDDDEGDEAF
jgi:spoIIIJ-associated protein